MLLILQQVFVLYIFIFFGWLLGRLNKKLPDHSSIFSFFMVNLFLPCKIFRTLSQQFTIEDLQSKWVFLLISVAMLLCLHFLSKLPAKALAKDDGERRVYEYSLTITNYGYMGYALVESVFGADVLSDMIFFCIPFSIYTYTVGYLKLTNRKPSPKRLCNPMTIAIALGLSAGVLNIRLPQPITQVFSSAANCTGPISMLLVGLVLSSFDVKNLFSHKSDYLLIALRLVILPLLVFSVCKLLGLHNVLAPALFVCAMPTGLNTIVFTQGTDTSPEIGARLAFLSHIASCVTLPLWLSII